MTLKLFLNALKINTFKIQENRQLIRQICNSMLILILHR